MMNKAINLHCVISSAFGFVLILLSNHVAAAFPPDDEWYAGGPMGYPGPNEISETWHGIWDNGDLILLNKNLTLLRKGSNGNYKWFLILDTSLNGQWKTNPIPLEDYPTFNEFGDVAQWRWKNTPPVKIIELGHPRKHDICIGYPTASAKIDPEDDEFIIMIVEEGDPCGDPHDHEVDDHPGHSGAGR